MTQEIFEIVKIPFTKSDPSLVHKTLSAIPKSNGGIMGTGSYAVEHLKRLFSLAGEMLPSEYVSAPRDKPVYFENTGAAILCLDILKKQQVALFLRTQIATSTVFQNNLTPLDKGDSFQHMYEFIDAETAKSSPLFIEEMIGSIPYSRTGFSGKGTYQAGHLKRIYALARENIPDEHSGLVSCTENQLVLHPNVTVAILCLDAMKLQGAFIEERSFLLSLTCSTIQNNLSIPHLRLVPESADPHP